MSAESQNFRVKKGLEVGSATTITSTDSYISGQLSVAGVTTFISDVTINGSILTGGGSATIGDDLTTRNIYSTGVSTFIGAITGSSASFSGDVTVLGDLTYENVVNVDSIGIATARSGLRVTGGGLDVVGVSTFSSNIDANGDLDVENNTELNTVNVSGASTFVGVGTFQNDLYVAGALDVDGNVNFNGLLFQNNAPFIASYWVQTGAGIHTLGSVGIGTSNPAGSLEVSGHTELDDVNVSGIITAFDIDIDGHTELDNVNVSGVSTFVGIVTTQDDLFVGNDLSVSGDARIVGVLTVGSGTITIDGDSNTINVGTGATLHTTTVSVNQLEVAGLSTFAGIGTFQNNLFVGGTLYTPEIVLNGSSLGEDVSTRNISASGIVTVTGATDLNGDLDVDGHTELDNVNVSGFLTATSAYFSNDVTILGTLTYEDVVNVDSIGIATARSGLRVTGGGLDVVGVSTFQNNVHFGDNDKALFGNSQDLEIYHNGTNSVLYHNLGSGYLSLRSNASTGGIHFYDADSATYWGAMEAATGAVNLNFNGSKKFETTAGGVDITGHTELDNVNISGVLTATSAEFSGNVTIGGVLTYEDVVNVDSVGIATARSGLRITGGGLDVVGVSTFSGNIDLNADLDVDGHTELDNLNVSGVSTFSGNIDLNADLDVDGHTELDNLNVSGVSTFGDTLKVYNSGNDSYIDNIGTGSLYIRDTNGTGTNQIIIQARGGENSIVVVDDGAVELYYDAVKKFETTGIGVTINHRLDVGEVNASGVITATSFYGDASNLTGIPAGLGTALSQNQSSPLNQLYYTDTILGVANTITVNPPDSSNIAYTQYAEIVVDQDADLIVEDGDDLIPDILGLSTGTAAPLSGAGGRIRADNFTSKSGTGAPAFPYGVVVTGVVTATSFDGGLSSLNVDGSTILQAEASGVTVSGILTTSTINAEIIGYDNVLDSDITITNATKTAIIHIDEELTVDIEEGVTITIDDDCFLNIIS